MIDGGWNEEYLISEAKNRRRREKDRRRPIREERVAPLPAVEPIPPVPPVPTPEPVGMLDRLLGTDIKNMLFLTAGVFILAEILPAVVKR